MKEYPLGEQILGNLQEFFLNLHQLLHFHLYQRLIYRAEIYLEAHHKLKEMLLLKKLV
jgi:hypothetical protein